MPEQVAKQTAQKKQSKRAHKEDQMLGIGSQTEVHKRGQFALWLRAFFFCFTLSILQIIFQSSALAQSAINGQSDAPETLFLEVMINEQATNLIGSFVRNSDGKIGAAASELNEIGIKTPKAKSGEDIVYLEDINSVRYAYDESAQILNITILEEQRLAREYNKQDGDEEGAPLLTPSGMGAVVNYSVFASSAAEVGGEMKVEDVSTSLDGWLYGPLGKVYGSGIISTSNFSEFEFLRLDTTWTYSDPKSLLQYNVGDSISGGLAWTRPVRMGGLQVQKNFGLRPDLIATPLLQASGSAAVPSTVDVYIGNFKAFSQQVDAGPFTINQIPTVSGGGEARIVVRDATGREEETVKPFYASSNLLRKGLLDYSVEAGFARLNYGTISNNYSDKFMASGTFRYGVTDKFTLEGHVEGSENLINGGLGATFTVAERALLNVAGSVSSSNTGVGYLGYASIDTELLGMTLHASTRRSFGDYQDLASITTSEIVDTGNVSTGLTGTGIAKAFDQVSVGIPLPKLRGGVNLSFTHLEDAVNEASNIGSISYSQKVFDAGTLSVSAYTDLDNTADYGVYVGVSFPIGKKIYGSVGTDIAPDGLAYRASVSKSVDSKPGSWGWRVSDVEGSTTQRSAGVTYRGHKTLSQLNVHQNEAGFQANAYVDGGMTLSESGAFFAHRIDDAFAVVDTGQPNVPVFLANRPVGVTNSRGKLLVPGLLSYEENQIRIDTKDLPINASVESTNQKVRPSDGAGVNVRFGVQTETSNAVVVFKDVNGEFIKVGSEGTLAGSGSEFIVGYDGRAFMENLDANNSVTIALDNGLCTAEFGYTSNQDTQVEIGPVICQ